MSQARIPPKGTALIAITDEIVVYDRPDLSAGHQRYSFKGAAIGPGNTTEDYHAGNPLGDSVGVTVLGPDGTEFVKTNTSSWEKGWFFTWTETPRVSYIELAKEGITWQRSAPDGSSEIDARAAFQTDVETNWLPDWRAKGVPDPTDYSIRDRKLTLTFPNGYSVDFESFKGLSLAQKLSYTAPIEVPDPKPQPEPTLNVWAIVAGAGLLTLLAVVIFIQVQRRRQ